MNDDADIGALLRKARLEKGYTLAQLAEKTGLSASFLSNVERNINSPAVNSLRRILDALGLSMADLFRGTLSQKVLVRPSDRVQIIKSNDNSIKYELLCAYQGRKMEPMLVTLKPGASSGETPHSHHGEEFGFIIKGKLRYWLGNQVFDLEEGDCIYYDASTPHRYKNIGDTECVSLWCVTPPSF